jgi:hypothetical protein
MMATRLDNIRTLSNGDDMGDVRIEDVIAQVVAPIQPTPIEAITTTSTIPKTQKQIIKSMVDSGALASGQAVLVNGTYYQPVYASSGSGQDYQQGALENVITYKEGDNKVGGNVNWYSPSGEFQQLTQQQEVNATKDFMQFAAMAGGLFGAPLAIGEALGLKGAAAGAVGQGLLTTGTQLGSGANLGDALMAGLKTGAVPIANAALSQIPQFAALSAPLQASVASAVGNIVANGGELTPAVLLSAVAAGLNAANQPNITPLEGLTNSGRTGDDMGGGYDRSIDVSQDTTMPSGVQVASLGETPFRLESGGAPIFAESSGASSVRPPAGYEVMSASLADNKPSGAYYDASVNAWMAPTNEFARVSDLDQILADIETFKNGQNTIDQNVIKNIVNESLSDLPTGITIDDVTRVLSSQNYATPQDIQTAINSIDIPQGLTEQNVEAIVSNILANNPNPTTSDIQFIVDNTVSKLPSAPTTQDIINIIGNQGLASTAQLTQQGKDLMDALQKQGFDYNTALNQALQAQGANLGSQVSNLSQQTQQQFAQQSAQTQQQFNSLTAAQQAQADALVKQGVSFNNALDQVQAGLGSQISDVQTGLGNVTRSLGETQQQISNLSQQTQQQLAQQSEQTQQQFQSLTAAQQKTADDLVKQGATVTQAIAQSQAQTQQQIGTLSQQTQQQFNNLTAAQQAQANALVNQGTSLSNAISQVQSGLGQQISNLSQQTQNQLTQQSAQTQQQFNTLTEAQKVQADALIKQGVSFNTALNQVQSGLGQQISNVVNQIGGVQTGLESKIANVQSSLESQLDAKGKALMDSLQQQGVDYQTALTQAIAQQNAQIGQVQTTFEEQFKNASAASADNFAKVMLSLAAIQDASKPKTFSYDVVDSSNFASPVYNQATGPVMPITPLDFGNREMLRGTQWEKFLDPNYGQVPAPVQFNQPTNMGYDQLMNILGTGRDTLPSQALTINDVISGIQNQYGQTPAGSMGQKPA